MLIRFLECTAPACRLRFPATEHDFARLHHGRCPRCGEKIAVVAVRAAAQEDASTRAVCKSPSRVTETIVDNVRSVFNVGAIFRSADGAGVDHLHLCGITPTPEHPKLTKTALGAQNAVAWTYHANALTAITDARARGVQVWALEDPTCIDPARSSQLDFVSLPAAAFTESNAPLALVVGNESAGIDPGALALCERVVYIPMRGQKRSLNVAVAYGIALYLLPASP